jgi:SNF2 family DNA or RNA helicase
VNNTNPFLRVVIDVDPEEDGKIIAMAGYRDGDPARYREAGGRWKAKRKVWQYPQTMESCRALRRLFGERLVINPALGAWAWEQRQVEDRLKALSESESATLVAVPAQSPQLAEAMGNRTYQQVAARFIAEAGNVLIADQPGLGKTLESIGGLMEAGLWRGPILVAAPLTSLHTVWQRELERFTPDALVTVAVPTWRDNAANRQRAIEHWVSLLEADTTQEFAHVLVVNPEMLRPVKVGEEVKVVESPWGNTEETVAIYEDRFPLLIDREWNAIILDESHRYLSGVRSQTDLTQMGKALLSLKVRDGGIRVALSGTPMRGKPKNLWGTLHWLRPDLYTSFWRWAQHYLEISNNGYGSTVGDIKPGVEQDLYKSLDGIMLRRTKAEVVKELPPKQYVDVICDMPPSQRRQYESMSKQSYAELGDERITALGVLAIMTRLKQMATSTWSPTESGKPESFMHPKTSGKTAMIEQMLIERGIAGDDREGIDKIVIASQFTEVIDSLGDYLSTIKVEYLAITGKVNERQRMIATQLFQSEGGPRVMLMNTKAGGVSITLDAYCSELIEIDETWVPDDQEQLEDRIHRVSRIHQVTIYRLSTADTIDERIRAITEGKEQVQKTLLDGRRGVEFAKLLIT